MSVFRNISIPWNTGKILQKIATNKSFFNTSLVMVPYLVKTQLNWKGTFLECFSDFMKVSKTFPENLWKLIFLKFPRFYESNFSNKYEFRLFKILQLQCIKSSKVHFQSKQIFSPSRNQKKSPTILTCSWQDNDITFKSLKIRFS